MSDLAGVAPVIRKIQKSVRPNVFIPELGKPLNSQA